MTAQRKNACVDEVKILIDNVLLATKINASMFSVQHIHDHTEMYVSILQSWGSKNYAFEFVDSISTVIQKEVMSNL